jgi:serine/threonine protein kinase
VVHSYVKLFARKLIRPHGAASRADIENEIKALNLLCSKKHPNLVHVINHYRLPCSPYYAIDMELCDLTLLAYIGGNREFVVKMDWHDWEHEPILDERRIRWLEITAIIVDILRGLVFIHSQHRVHRDIKPSNSSSQSGVGLILSSVSSELEYVEDFRFRVRCRRVL